MGVVKKYKRVVNSNTGKLSETQKEILYYLTEEFLTPSQIANIRGTSPQAVNKVIKKLKEKGFVKGVVKGSYFKGVASPLPRESDNKEYRLHAQKIKINIVNVTESYLRLLKIKNRDLIEHNTIMLYEDSIIIYSNKDFWGSSVNQCVRTSLDYWQRFFIKLENKFKVHLIRGNNHTIKEFGGEIARVNDPLAKKINLSSDTFRVFIGGELRLICDNSFKFNELESVHKNYYIKDMSFIERYYEDLLKNQDKLMLPSEIQKLSQRLLLQESKDQEFKNEVLLMVKALVREVEKLKRD